MKILETKISFPLMFLLLAAETVSVDIMLNVNEEAQKDNGGGCGSHDCCESSKDIAELKELVKTLAACPQETKERVNGTKEIVGELSTTTCTQDSSKELTELKKLVTTLAASLQALENKTEAGNHYGAQCIPNPSMLEDAAYNKPTFSSPIWESDYAAGYAVDNLESTEYCSALLDDPWWMVDLGAVRTIFHIIILPRQDQWGNRFYNIEIRIGDSRQTTGDFTSFTLLQFYEGPYKMGEGMLMYTFCSGVTGRYLSVQLKGKSGHLEIVTFKAIALKI